MKIRGNTVGTNIKPEKILVKATDLTEEEKAQARENIGVKNSSVYHLINESGKTVDNPVAMLGSYMTEPKVDDFVLTNTFNLYVVTGVDLVNQRVEVNLLGNLKGDSYVLTEQDKEEIANLVSVEMGDIDSALDSIIEIQNSLIGGDGA